MIACRLFAVLLVVSLLAPSLGRAAEGFADGVRTVFVAARETSHVGVIDARDDRLVATLDLGLVPSQVEIAGEPARLAALDGASTRLALVAVENGALTTVPLDFVPTRLLVAGRHVVAAAPAEGALAVVDVQTGRVSVQGRIAPFRDVQPVSDGARLLVAPEAGENLLLLDLATLAVVAEVAPPRPGLGGFSSLARSPGGRVVYARAATAPVVLAVDAVAGRVAGEITAGPGTARAYTNAMGITVFLPDSAARSIAVVPASLKGGAVLAGEDGMSAVYSGWFDTVAFIPSTATGSVVVVDQQGGFRGDDIILGARPGRGAVTPDGRKLYLPLVDANRVAIIDAETRRLAGYVTLPFQPGVALMARTFGLCH